MKELLCKPINIKIDFNKDISVRDLLKRVNKTSDKLYFAVEYNNEPIDADTVFKNDAEINLIDFDSEIGKDIYWHSTSHIMAQAILQLYPGTKLTIGPSIDEGFYYDCDFGETKITPDDLHKIEKMMKKIIKRNIPIKKSCIEINKAIETYNNEKNNYKVELLNQIKDDVVTFYHQDNFFDLCRGPHVPSTGYIKQVKLQSIAGAYWRGDEKRTMLTRIYGISFPEEAQLKEYLYLIEEAKKRDHRKLGKQLDLFSFHLEAPGFPFFHANGNILYNTIINYWRKIHTEYGYQEVKTPFILNEQLWHRSGHWENYKENMYFTKIDDDTYAIKPMNCPGGLLIYKTQIHSYRELPLKMSELGQVHRHEKSGVLHGLFRVRTFVVDDAHIFCLENQILEMVNETIEMILKVYKTFGFKKYFIELSTKPEKHIGSDDVWEKSTDALKRSLEAMAIDYKLNPGDGAFYGPKIDFHIEDSLKRTWQCGTIQLDFSMPEKFGLEYIGSDNKPHRPVMIHRAVFGSVERFMGMLIEHYAGALPLWLAPEQIRILPIADRHTEYCLKLKESFTENGLRTDVDSKSEKIGYKIREAQNSKIPYMIIIGDNEINNNIISVRHRKEGDIGNMDIVMFMKKIEDELEISY